MALPRAEYPRPNFTREKWLNLNGEWNFDFDDQNIGLNEKWYQNHHFNKKITVPYAYQTKLSGIGKSEFHDVVWYERIFTVPAEWEGENILLHFGAVDYRATVWVNGIHVASHQGGNTPFYANITCALITGENSVVVRAEDFSTDLAQPRGKQFWEEKSSGIFYTRTTGIWQTVWLEPVSEEYIKKINFTPNIDEGSVNIDYNV